MQIKEKHIQKYQKIFFEEYGFEIDKTQALEELSSLICLLNAVYQHINKTHGKS